jgi:Mg2+ and Co2+ transporter CorA
MNNKVKSFSSTLPALFIAAGLALLAVSISACASSTSAQTANVVIAPLGSGDSASTSGITREELEDHVRRFADRYITRVALATNSVSNNTDNQALKELMQRWKSVAYASVVDIAIGPNAVTNLLDMMTLTTLSRTMVEGHWVPNALGTELGEGFLQTFIDLEDDIWTVADDVLTKSQQDELRSLINDWYEANPEQIYPWYVRLSDFSGQRAASLAAVQQTGGMLKEVARAREAAEEIQAFGERVLFYLQRAPMITSAEFQASANDVLGGPQVLRAINDMDRFVAAVERLVQSVEDLPGSRIVAVDQIMDRIREERVALVRDLASSEADFASLLAELQPALDSLERLTSSDEQDPDSKPFDINEYTALVSESATTAIELRRLAETVDSLMQNSAELSSLVEALVEAEHAIVDRAFMQAIALIFIFFLALLGYRFLAGRLIAT